MTKLNCCLSKAEVRTTRGRFGTKNMNSHAMQNWRLV